MFLHKILLLILLLPLSIFAQKQDSLSEFKIQNSIIKHSPNKAAWLSAVVPGLGQAYNKKYWKIPIMYAGFGACAYAINYNLGYYRKFKTAYSYRIDNDPNTIDEFANTAFTAENLRYYKNIFKRDLDISYIFTGAIYLLNVVDAYVDAQLFDFDISNDLSLRLEPNVFIISNQQLYGCVGLRIELNR